MKCGTTSVAEWLDDLPDVVMAHPKEPGFFSLDQRWRRGVDWYGSLFSPARSGQLAGEASTNYTHPAMSARASERISTTVPDVRLICLLRDPIERLRSQYRDRRLWGNESRSLVEVLQRQNNPYLAFSKYYSCLKPYLDRFPRERLCIARTEDLGRESGPA